MKSISDEESESYELQRSLFRYKSENRLLNLQGRRIEGAAQDLRVNGRCLDSGILGSELLIGCRIKGGNCIWTSQDNNESL
jgi:hypothetical protein